MSAAANSPGSKSTQLNHCLITQHVALVPDLPCARSYGTRKLRTRLPPGRRRKSTFAPEALTIADHFVSSRSMSAAYSSGVDASGSAPSSARRDLSSSDVTAARRRSAELVDDRLRRARRRHDAVVQHRLVARQRPRDRRQIREDRRERLAWSPQRPHLPSFTRATAGERAEIDPDMAADQIGQRRRTALVGNMGQLDAGGSEILATEMDAAAGPGRGIGQRARRFLCEARSGRGSCAPAATGSHTTSALVAISPIRAKSLRGS